VPFVILVTRVTRFDGVSHVTALQLGPRLRFDRHPGLGRRDRRLRVQETALASNSEQGGGNEAPPIREARESILDELQTRKEWKVAELPELLRSRLLFIRDCHTRIGKVDFGGHEDFWYDTTLELHERDGVFLLSSDGASHTVVAINDEPPEGFLRPSLNALGEPVYRIGILSSTKPEPLVIEASDAEGTQQFEIDLSRSEFTHYAREIFREDRIGGIPVIRIRSFTDAEPEILNRFVETANRLREEPLVIVDIRGNRGGSEFWVNDWIQELTGHRPGSVFITSELNSRTTMAGRAIGRATAQNVRQGPRPSVRLTSSTPLDCCRKADRASR